MNKAKLTPKFLAVSVVVICVVGIVFYAHGKRSDDSNQDNYSRLEPDSRGYPPIVDESDLSLSNEEAGTISSNTYSLRPSGFVDDNGQPLFTARLIEGGGSEYELSSSALGIRFKTDSPVSNFLENTYTQFSQSPPGLSDSSRCVLMRQDNATTSSDCITITFGLNSPSFSYYGVEYEQATFTSWDEQTNFHFAKTFFSDQSKSPCARVTHMRCNVQKLSDTLYYLHSYSVYQDERWHLTYAHVVPDGVVVYSFGGIGTSSRLQIEDSVEFFAPQKTVIPLKGKTDIRPTINNLYYDQHCDQSGVCTFSEIVDAFGDDESKVIFNSAHHAWFDQTLSLMREYEDLQVFGIPLGNEGNVPFAFFTYVPSEKKFRYLDITTRDFWFVEQEAALLYTTAQAPVVSLEKVNLRTGENRTLVSLADDEDLYHICEMGCSSMSGWLDDTIFGLAVYESDQDGYLNPFSYMLAINVMNHDVEKLHSYYAFIEQDLSYEERLIYVTPTTEVVTVVPDVQKRLRDAYGAKRVFVYKNESSFIRSAVEEEITFAHYLKMNDFDYKATSTYSLLDDSFRLVSKEAIQ